MNDEILSKLHSALLGVMLEFKRICDEHNLRYLLGYGTLLGAVRHKGFIPWDDDADIIMPRVDYEKFVDIAEKELNENFTIHCSQKLDDYPFNFTKIYDNRTIYENPKMKNLSFCNGISMDIFPTDYADKHYLRHIYTIRIFSFIKRRKINFNVPTSKYVKFLCKFVPLKLCNHIIRKQPLYYKKSKEMMCQMCSGDYDIDKPFPADYFDNYIMGDFENHKFKIPKEYDAMLTQLYGDYMTLPPVEERQEHKAINISFK